MIKNFKIFENGTCPEDLINKIQSVLTPDLLRGMWKKDVVDHPTAGHCYIATEALYWMLGGPDGDYKPYVLTHKVFPEGLDRGETHWFLKNKKNGKILDPTAEQFGDIEILYDRGISNGMMNYPVGGSNRSKEIIKRIESKGLKEIIRKIL